MPPRRGASSARSSSDPVPSRWGLVEMRALAHPLRLQICQLFADRPRTTKQVAALLGEPPTRLYHHVHALEKAGLLRLRETRQKRGTQEKYYELTRVPHGLEGAKGAAHATPGPRHRAAAAALAASALDVARLESAAALAESGGRQGTLQPLIARLIILSPAGAKRIRTEILAMIRRHAKAGSAGTAKPARGRPWSLTLALLPTGTRAKKDHR